MLPLKHRYILTRNNRLRLRYVASALALVFTTGAASYSHIDWPSAPERASTQRVAYLENFAPAAGDAITQIKEHIAQTQSALSSVSQAKAAVPATEEVQEEAALAEAQHAFADLHALAKVMQKPAEPVMKDLKLAGGDTLSEVLQDAGVSVRDAVLAIRAMSDHVDPRRIKAGQEIKVQTSLNDAGETVLDEMIVPLSVAKAVVIARNEDAYNAALEEKEVFQNNFAKNVKIDSSLYASAARVGVPPQIIAELIRVYSWDVDFQRDIRSGDELQVLYSAKETEDGEFAGYGDIAFASLTIGGKARPIYRYEMKDGRIDYFEPDGHSIRKTLMKTPVDGARLSSGFGMRKHPVLGYTKMHKGTDFAAPTGTPIYAAGDGVVEYAGRKGGYGNYIRVRHNGTLKTAYAHMHKFAKGMTTGKRVEQGQIIGYIGTTGRSTGPHLHYEVLKNDVQVNPNSVDLPVGEILKDQEYARFKALVGATDQEYASLIQGLKVASSDKNKAGTNIQ